MMANAKGGGSTLMNIIDQIKRDVATCSVCQDVFQTPQRTPKLLQCCHTFCEPCLSSIASGSGALSILCPICRNRTQLPRGRGGIKRLTSNFDIISILEILSKQTTGPTHEDKAVQCQDDKRLDTLLATSAALYDQVMQIETQCLNIQGGGDKEHQTRERLGVWAQRFRKQIDSLIMLELTSNIFVSETSAAASLLLKHLRAYLSTRVQESQRPASSPGTAHASSRNDDTSNPNRRDTNAPDLGDIPETKANSGNASDTYRVDSESNEEAGDFSGCATFIFATKDPNDDVDGILANLEEVCTPSQGETEEQESGAVPSRKVDRFLQEQSRIIRRLLNLPLVKGEKRFLVSSAWFDQWRSYVGYDPHGTEGDETSIPGAIDNGELLQDDGVTLQDDLLDDYDYVHVPQEAWDNLVTWYGTVREQEAISRAVIERGMIRNLEVEVYLLPLKLYKDDEEECVIHLFSRAETIDDIEQMTRMTFQIPETVPVRLWSENTTGTYQELSQGNTTIEDAKLFSNQVIIIEEICPDEDQSHDDDNEEDY